MSKLFRKKLAICWFAVQFLYFAMTTDVNRTGTYELKLLNCLQVTR